MNGVYCSTRPMRISAATPKKALLNTKIWKRTKFMLLHPFKFQEKPPTFTLVLKN
jgi:hypothetical protein